MTSKVNQGYTKILQGKTVEEVWYFRYLASTIDAKGDNKM